jgi:hypothetical protein
MSIDGTTKRTATGRLIIALAVVLVIAAGLAVWLWPRPDNPRTEEALRSVLAIGGPAGWASTEPVSLLPQNGQTGKTESRHGVLVGILPGDAGFTATWTTTADEPAVCDTLAGWAVRVVQHPARDEVRDSCRAAGNGLFASYGTPVSGGRKMFYAAADNGVLTAGVAYRSENIG